MKQIMLSFTVVLLLVACNNEMNDHTSFFGIGTTPNTASIDTARARKDLSKMLDSIHSSFSRKDVGYVDKYMAKDGLFMGTDPGELWSFNELRTAAVQQFRDTSINSFDYKVDQRIIRINGTSANLVEQFNLPALSTKMMFRTVGHARYEKGRWVIDMLTYNAVPKNEDLQKIDRAL